MLWIGITGPMGGGKSTVSDYLRRLGYTVVDADVIVRDLLSPGGPVEEEIFKTFGQVVRGVDGHLDRRALGGLVFGDPLKLEILENLIHPHVRRQTSRQKRQLIEKGVPAAFYDVPLLFEKKMEDQFDLIWVVTAPAEIRTERLVRRTGLSIAEIEERFRRQLPPEFKEARASTVIRNDGNLDHLQTTVHDTLKRLGIPSPTSA